jgi:hypothetical protein
VGAVAGRTVDPEAAVDGGDPVGEAAQPRAVGVGAADPVVADLDDELAVSRRALIVTVLAWACLAALASASDAT